MERCKIMGILNVTPDSFYDGGRYFSIDEAVRYAERMAEEGADIIDIGGESTRPGSEPVGLEEELKRVIPVIERLKINIPISIDTQKAEVARQALERGASIVNDVSAMRNDPMMMDVVRKYNMPVVLMHMKGTPKDMQVNPYYYDVVSEIKEFFKERLQSVGMKNVILDPGIGFGKRVEDNLEILRRLGEFKEFGLPILVGPSRKSFITAREYPEACFGDESAINSSRNKIPRQLAAGYFIGNIDRLWGTAGAVAVSVMNGADIVRVHDVAGIRQVVEIVDRIAHADNCYIKANT